ncbi:MAG TPA: hypothetical protein DER10_09890 [Elusimicrobia bacterium]|nr:hypothetical protein [Elusimicrobiota bacterium]
MTGPDNPGSGNGASPFLNGVLSAKTGYLVVAVTACSILICQCVGLAIDFFLWVPDLRFLLSIGFIEPLFATPPAAFAYCLLRDELIKGQEEIRKTNLELQETLKNIRELGELLPMCTSCKRIKVGEKELAKLEIYITQHSKAFFSHGICSDCLKKFYPEYAD